MPAVKTIRYGSITTAASTAPNHNVLDLGAAIPGFYSLQEYQQNEGGSEAVSIPFAAWNGRKQVFGVGTVTATDPAQFTIDQVLGASENGTEATWPFELIAGTQIQFFNAARMFELMSQDQGGSTTDSVSFASISVGAVEELLVTAANNVDVEIFNTEDWRERVEHTSYFSEVGKPPKWCAAVLRTSVLDIFDITDPSTPIWMTFNLGANNIWPTGGTGATSVNAINGCLLLENNGVQKIDFVKDEGLSWGTNFNRYNGTIGDRNSALGFTVVSPGGGIINNSVNGIAATIRTDAQPDTNRLGLPYETVAVPTAIGVSIINPTGTFADRDKVVHSAITLDITTVDFDENGNLYFGRKGTTGFWLVTDYSADSFTHAYQFGAASSPPVLVDGEHIRAGEHIYVGGTFNNPDYTGLAMVSVDAETPTNSIATKVTSKQPPMWLPGGTVGAWLCDSVEETVGGESVTNGTDPTDTTGWVNTQSGTFEAIGGKFRATKTVGASRGGGGQTITTEVGTKYRLVVEFDNTNNSANGFINISSAGLTEQIVGAGTATATYMLDFTAGATGTVISCATSSTSSEGSYIEWNKVSVVPVIEDLSGNGNHLAIQGTLPKAVAATDTDLVLYGGFDASNYAFASHNSLLNIGTGDFLIVGEIDVDATSGSCLITSKSATQGTDGFGVWYDDATTEMKFQCGVSVVLAASAPASGIFGFSVRRVSGVVTISVAGAELASAIMADDVTTTESLYVGAGGWFNGTGHKLGRLRISTNGGTAELVSMIENDERWQRRAGNKCTLGGISDAITGRPSYDPTTGKLDVPTADGLDTFSRFNRIDRQTTGGLQISSDTMVAVDRVNDMRLLATDAEVQIKKPARDL